MGRVGLNKKRKCVHVHDAPEDEVTMTKKCLDRRRKVPWPEGKT